MLTIVFLSKIPIRKGRRFVSKQGQPQPQDHSKASTPSAQLLNGLLSRSLSLVDHFISSHDLYLGLSSIRRNWMLVSLRAVRGNKEFFLANYWKRSTNWTLLIFVNLFLELWSIQGQRYHTPCPSTKVTTYPWYILVFIQVDSLKDVGFRYPYFITEGQKESNVLHLQHSRKEQIMTITMTRYWKDNWKLKGLMQRMCCVS